MIIIKILSIMRKISIGIYLVKSLEEVVRVIILNNYPTTLSYSSSSYKHIYITASSRSNSY